MYGFVTHTWNPIKGECIHDCKYCYMKVWKQRPLRLDEKDLNDDLGEDNFIFVGSSTDMFADDVSALWIAKFLEHCKKFDNRYLFQSKNPAGFCAFSFPDDVIFGTTIETNREYDFGNAPTLKDRTLALGCNPLSKYDKMVSIEPIMDFDLNELVEMIRHIKPKFVSIGADSKGHNLPEPSWEKVQQLIKELKAFTEVKIKDNLMRLKK